MIEFILNNTIIKTEKPKEMILLDFIRNDENLSGTKTGCREGDCGACTVLEGRFIGGKLVYKTIVSCLTPLANVAGNHIVTIEGLNQEELTPVQQIFVDEAATQCGFCTPGFIVSLTNFALSDNEPIKTEIIDSIAGNICRCTGYKSIEKAAEGINNDLKNKDIANKIDWLIKQNYIPSYFKEIPEKLNSLKIEKSNEISPRIIAGGTDLYVQKPEEMLESEHFFILKNSKFKGIEVNNKICTVGAANTVTDLAESAIINNAFPNLKEYIELISSSQIRNMATIGGNLVNASPIGDLSIFFLALNAKLLVSKLNSKNRSVYLKDFFQDYKKFDLNKDELIENINFELPTNNHFFNFEKVSKRTHLDIATVNSAIYLKVENNLIKEISISAGGLAATPKLLIETNNFLINKEISSENVEKAIKIALSEVKPISDIRGSKEYKLLLLRQLIFAHFIKLFPSKVSLNQLSEIK